MKRQPTFETDSCVESNLTLKDLTKMHLASVASIYSFDL